MSSIQEVHYFTAFHGLTGAAYDATNPDGGLRPFKIGKVDPRLFHLMVCVLTLDDGGIVMGNSFVSEKDAFEDARVKI